MRFAVRVLAALTLEVDVMHRDDNVSLFLSVFTLEVHLLSSGLTQDERLAQPPFSSQQGEKEGEKRGESVLLLSYLSLNKSL